MNRLERCYSVVCVILIDSVEPRSMGSLCRQITPSCLEIYMVFSHTPGSLCRGLSCAFMDGGVHPLVHKQGPWERALQAVCPALVLHLKELGCHLLQAGVPGVARFGSVHFAVGFLPPHTRHCPICAPCYSMVGAFFLFWSSQRFLSPRRTYAHLSRSWPFPSQELLQSMELLLSANYLYPERELRFLHF